MIKRLLKNWLFASEIAELDDLRMARDYALDVYPLAQIGVKALQAHLK